MESDVLVQLQCKYNESFLLLLYFLKLIHLRILNKGKKGDRLLLIQMHLYSLLMSILYCKHKTLIDLGAEFKHTHNFLIEYLIDKNIRLDAESLFKILKISRRFLSKDMKL